MKRARIMLAAIAVLGLVGGALAFKAHQKFTFNGLYTTTVAGGKCEPVIASTAGAVPLGQYYSSLTTAVGGLTYFTTIDSKTYYCTNLTPAFASAGE